MAEKITENLNVGEVKKVSKTKHFKFKLTPENIYRVARDFVLVILLLVFIVGNLTLNKAEVVNATYDQSLQLFYSSYGNEIRMLSHDNISMREDKIRVLLEKYIKERYGVSIFSPAEKLKYQFDYVNTITTNTNVGRGK
jgi:hypothetical protein